VDTPGAPRGDTQVRIGDLAVSIGDGQCLVTVGLGSCVGVALVDVGKGIVGLAHVFLPQPPPEGIRSGAGAGTYATLAVPELARQVAERAGHGQSRRLVAILVGGAKMFAGRSGIDIGERNIVAVREGLSALGIRIVSEETGGTSGRTVRVTSGPQGGVALRAVGEQERTIWSRTSAVGSSTRADQIAA